LIGFLMICLVTISCKDEEDTVQLPPSLGDISFVLDPPEGKLHWPHHRPEYEKFDYDLLIDRLWVINNFGQYQHGDVKGETYFHDGLDIVLPNGTELFSMSEGVVRSTRYDAIIIEDAENPGFGWAYTHVNNSPVKVGDVVSRGRYIGDVNFIGLEHLHLSRVKLEVGGNWDDIFDLKFLYADSLFIFPDKQSPVFDDAIYFFRNNSDEILMTGEITGDIDIVAGIRDRGEYAASRESGFGNRLAITHITYEIDSETILPQYYKSIDFRNYPLQRKRPNILFDYERLSNVYKYYFDLKPATEINYDRLMSYYVVTNTNGAHNMNEANPPDKKYSWQTDSLDENGEAIFPNGLYTIKVTAYDAMGNSAVTTAEVIVNN